jgi:DNA polymerase-1
MEAEEITWDCETGPYWREHKEYAPSWHPDFFIVSIAFTTREGESFVVPLHHRESPWKDPRAVLRFLKPCLERADGKYAAHNGKTPDVRSVAAYARVFIPQTFDTMLAAHMLDENRLKGLKPLSEIELGADGYDLDKEKKQDLYNQPWKDVAYYNGLDTDYTHRLWHQFRRQLQEPDNRRMARVFMKLMMPASNMLAEVETTGVWLDPRRLEERNRQAHANLRKIREFLSSKGAAGVNFNSPPQVAKWLFGKPKDGGLGLTPIFYSPKTKAPSTNEATILRLARENKAVRGLLIYRKWAKYESTYLRPWLRQRDVHSRFHPGYKPYGTVTGRLSGDFQQVPRDPFIRSIVGAPPGWVLLKADYSQIELRIAAMLADERRMLGIFRAGGDIHLTTAMDLVRRPAGEISSEQRKKAKAVNFGFLYGMGASKFGAYAFENYGVVVSEADCTAYRNRFFKLYPALLPWHERQRQMVHNHGQVVSPIGRIRHLPDVYSRDRVVYREAERQAINSPVQSCASDLMLNSMIELNRELPKQKAMIVATIHDEILFQVKEDYVDEAATTIKTTMEDMDIVRRKFGANITVPIVAEIEVGQHWGRDEMVAWP